MANPYHFVSHWRVKARAEEVYDIIGQPLEYPRWWPSVYLDAQETHSGVKFHTKGWLPYTLRWEATTTERIVPSRIVLEASGDLEGTGTWTFTQDGEFTDMTFDWNVAVGKRLLQFLSPGIVGRMTHPAFEANHKWAMAQGEIGLTQELIRYRARTPEDMMEAVDPRGPVQVPVRWIAAGALALSALAYMVLSRRKSEKPETVSA